MKVKLHLNYAGHCFAKENHAIRGGRRKNIAFHALWGIIEHPVRGYILYDTGYTERFFEATKRFPNKIYAKITKVFFEPGQSAASQLRSQGIEPEDIRHLLITHFHGDHVCGLLDFPNATFYATTSALNQALEVPKHLAFSKGILKGLLPETIKERTVLIDQKCTAVNDPILGTCYDIFGDSSIKAAMLPGHARGQFGILLNTEKSNYFLIADACWLKKSYTDNVFPHPIVRLFFDSWSDFKKSLSKVHQYHKAHPETVIVPTHCAESTDPLVREKIDWHAL